MIFWFLLIPVIGGIAFAACVIGYDRYKENRSCCICYEDANQEFILTDEGYRCHKWCSHILESAE